MLVQLGNVVPDHNIQDFKRHNLDKLFIQLIDSIVVEHQLFRLVVQYLYRAESAL